MNNEMKNMAKRLGMAIPEDATEHEQLASIANQCGMPDYYYNSQDNAKLYNTLKDMCGEYGIPEDIAGTDYDPDLEPDYMSQKYQDSREDKPYEDGEEDLDTEGEPDTSSDDSSSTADTSSGDTSDSSDSNNPNDNGYDPNKKAPEEQQIGPDGKPLNNPNNNPNDPNNPNKDGNNPNNPNDPNGNNRRNNNGNQPPGQNAVNQNGTGIDGGGQSLDDHSNQGLNNQPGSNNRNQNKGNNEGTPNNQSQGETGNGYGALRNRKKQNPNNNDGTNNARRTLDHNRRMSGGGDESSSGAKQKDNSSSSGKNKKSGLGSKLSNFGNKAKNNLKNRFGGNHEGEKNSDGAGGANGLGSRAKQALINLIKRHPIIALYVLIAMLLAIVILAVLMANAEGSRGKNAKKTCTYNLSGVTSTGTVELKNVKVELVNCDAKQDNYEVLETIDFEKYILGVALAEAGESSPDEALKAQMIAVRGFSLYRNNGMCPGHPDDCFYGYNATTNTIRMRACTNDQVYWDYTKDIYQETRSGQPSLYGKEAEANGRIWKHALSPQRQKEVETLANSVIGEVLLDNNGNVLNTNYVNVQTQQFIDMAKEGKKYKEILETVYGSSNYSSAVCTYSGIDYGDYTLSSDGKEILHEPIDQFLQKNGSSLEELNQLIEKNVEKNGYGTRAGVVAAAVTLIGEMGDAYGVKIPYYWGGGHFDGVVVGALNTWGSTQCHTYANGQSYNYCGLDCSGFVPWAIKNGGFNSNHALAGGFTGYFPGAKKVSLNRNQAVVEPGDLLESEGHIILIVGIDDESKQYICAEAMGNAYGVTFSRRSFGESSYWGVDMSGYYDNPSNLRSK